MQRREFITLLGGAAATWPLAARAQQPERMRRIGVLIGLAASDPEGPARLTAFQQVLEKQGWTERQNLRTDIRFAAADPSEMRVYANELIGMTPDVIIAGSSSAFAALKNEARIPIVFIQVADPVGDQRIASLANPGGNITGFTSFEYTIGGKWLETLKDAVPAVNRVIVIFDPNDPSSLGHLRTIESAGAALDVRVTGAQVRDATEIERAIDVFGATRDSGLIVLPGPITARQRDRIITLAAQHRLPAVYPYRYFATSGGLMSYGIDTVDLFRRAATYVDRILRGERPGNLPIQRPTKFEFVINLKTAKALGLNISESFLLRADEVIE